MSPKMVEIVGLGAGLVTHSPYRWNEVWKTKTFLESLKAILGSHADEEYCLFPGEQSYLTGQAFSDEGVQKLGDYQPRT